MNFRRFFYICLCLYTLSNSISFAQNHWKTWENTNNPDTTRLEAMKQHIWANYIFWDKDSALILNQLQYDLAYETKNWVYVASSLNTSGVIYHAYGELDSAYFYLSQALDLSQKIGYKKGISSNRANLAAVLTEMALYEEAIDYYFQSLSELEQAGDLYGQSQVLNNIGMVYANLDYQDMAISYYTKSMLLAEEAGMHQDLAGGHINLGAAYVALGHNEQAKASYEKAYEVAKKYGDERKMAIALENLGNYYNLIGEFDRALDNHLSTLDYYRRTEDYQYLTSSLTEISGIYRSKGNYEASLNYGLEALDYAFQQDVLYLMWRTSENLFFTYSEMGDHEKAVEMLLVADGCRDSIQQIENKSAAIEQNYKYNYEKQAAIDSVNFENKTRLKNLKISEQNAQINQEKALSFALWIGVLALFVVAFLLWRGYRRKKADNVLINEQKKEVEEQRDIAEKQRVEIDRQHQELHETHKEITDSINYAKRLQDAILPPLSEISANLPQSFVLFHPKDVVSGDFYWYEKTADGQVLIAAADCTGHGVPGSMVSVVCSSALNRSVKEFGLTRPAAILNKTREIVVETFAKSGEAVRDGMDIALCAVGKEGLRFCGANNPLWIVRKLEHITEEQLEQRSTVTNDSLGLIEVSANRQPVGKDENANDFTEHEIPLFAGDTFYLFSDGFADQFGEKTGKKFKKKPFKELLLHINHNSMPDQEKLLLDAFNVWKGNIEQIDDVCIVGVRL